MKKFKVFLLTALMALCMTGCGQTGDTDLFHSSSGGSSDTGSSASSDIGSSDTGSSDTGSSSGSSDTGSSDSSSSSSSSNPSTWEDEEEFWTDFH